jgi:RNA polymerase sigma-70 factor, ECF subfamily
MDDKQILELVMRVAARDEAAFRELFRAFRRKVYSYALVHLHDAARADEVVVDTMHDVWRKAGGFRGDSQFSTWLFGIARNHVLMALRTRSRREKPDVSDNLDELTEALADTSPSAFEVLARHQRSAQIRACLSGLPTEQREAVHLVFFEEWTLSNVATLLAVPEGTVKSRLFHARQKLRVCLQQQLERDGMKFAPAGSDGKHRA